MARPLPGGYHTAQMTGGSQAFQGSLSDRNCGVANFFPGGRTERVRGAPRMEAGEEGIGIQPAPIADDCPCRRQITIHHPALS